MQQMLACGWRKYIYMLTFITDYHVVMVRMTRHYHNDAIPDARAWNN